MKNNFKSGIKKLNLQIEPIFEKSGHEKYVTDWRGQYRGDAAILRPCNKSEISEILKFANYFKLPVVPQKEVIPVYVEAQPQLKILIQ